MFTIEKFLCFKIETGGLIVGYLNCIAAITLICFIVFNCGYNFFKPLVHVINHTVKFSFRWRWCLETFTLTRWGRHLWNFELFSNQWHQKRKNIYIYFCSKFSKHSFFTFFKTEKSRLYSTFSHPLLHCADHFTHWSCAVDCETEKFKRKICQNLSSHAGDYCAAYRNVCSHVRKFTP